MSCCWCNIASNKKRRNDDENVAMKGETQSQRKRSKPKVRIYIRNTYSTANSTTIVPGILNIPIKNNQLVKKDNQTVSYSEHDAATAKASTLPIVRSVDTAVNTMESILHGSATKAPPPPQTVNNKVEKIKGKPVESAPFQSTVDKKGKLPSKPILESTGANNLNFHPKVRTVKSSSNTDSRKYPNTEVGHDRTGEVSVGLSSSHNFSNEATKHKTTKSAKSATRTSKIW